jgi:DNA-binding FrmR family transcriptional regulator
MPRTVVGIDPRAREQILARLRSVEGHLRGIIRMVEEDQYCVDVIKQAKAVQRAIDKVTALVLERHLKHCATAAIRSESPRGRGRAISELLEIFENGRPR